MDSALNTQLLPVFGHLPLDRIEPTGVHRWFDEYSLTAPAGANRTLDVLRQVLGFAVSCGHIAANPSRSVRRNRRPAANRFLSRAEVARLHAVLDAHRGRGSGRQQAEVIRLLLFTGCRKGEIVGLHWAEVDGDVLRLRDGKTGPRLVYLNAEARAVLARQPRNGSDFVFPSLDDPLRPRSSELSLWRKVQTKAGLGDARLHDLRHTVGSHAVMAGAPIPVVSRLLGHRQPRMTLRYAHVGDRETEEAAERVGRAIAALIAEPAPPASTGTPALDPHRRPVTDRLARESSRGSGDETRNASPGPGPAQSGCDRNEGFPGSGSVQTIRLRAKNRITLPADIVATAGLEQGDVLEVEAEQGRVIISARGLRAHGRACTMSDLLGAAPGLHDSSGDIDAEIAAGRTD